MVKLRSKLDLGAAMDVAEWLRTLGLERYETTFHENDINAEILPNLTSDDLKDLGITSVGHRRHLLEAIAALRVKETPAADAVQSFRAPRPNPTEIIGWSETTAERRQLSVMFCDMADSTRLSTSLDPEDLSALLRAYQSSVASTIERFGGFIARYVGDGVLIYFGWPEARENDAERAVRAALDVISVLAGSPIQGKRLSVRVGIATGVVVVGAPIGAGAARQQTAIGETPNLAARLQGLAGANGIAIDGTTRRQLGSLFDYQDLGELALKGFPEPLPAWLVLGERNIASRFEALHTDKLVPLIGREAELAQLEWCWRQAQLGVGQAIQMSGEAGIGKSRLIAALEQRLEKDTPTRLRYFCSADQTDTALHAVVAGLQHEACFARGDSDAEKLNKLRSTLASTNLDASNFALIADMLSIPLQERPPILNASPQARKEATFAALLARLRLLAQSNPLLLILEDAHWADASTIELFNAAIPELADVASLLIILTRSDDTRVYIGGRIGGRPLRNMTLPRLDRRHAAMLASSVTAGTTVSAELLDRIVDQTDGIPLFIEELTKTVLETASAGTANHVPLVVPASLQASLMARLDRIPLAKEVAQVGAVFGREFPHNLLAVVADLPEPTLQRGLQQLVDSGLATCDGKPPPETTYTFKHALVRDTAYGMLLRSRRRELHSVAAAAFQDQFPELPERQPELLAYHYTQAGQAEPAISYWSKAAGRSVARSALVEALAQLRQALDLVPDLPGGPTRLSREMELQTTYGGALFAVQAWADGSAERAYSRALTLAEQLGDVEAAARVLGGRVTYHIGQCQYQEATNLALKLLQVSEANKAPSVRLIAHRCMGVCLHWTGNFAGALEHFDRVLGLYEPHRDRQLAAILGFDPRVQAGFLSCWDLLILGYPDRAVARFQRARDQLRDLDHKHSRVAALGFGGIFSLLMKNRELALGQLMEAVELATEQRFAAWIGISNVLLGSVVAETDNGARGLEQARAGYDKYITATNATHAVTGLAVNATYYSGLLALSYEAAGIPEEAQAQLNAAIDAAQRSGERWFEPELHRLKGEWLLAHRPGGEAEAALWQAIHQARHQNALFWELRASVSLARHYISIDASDRGCQLLLSVSARFDASVDFPDLREARAMLARLQS
jgi:class 3 adenylate cyclase/tetratricopeptide (TPR) repeat protein